jgi:predicted nucleic acid binding AN1-type Zn finger protein
MVSSASSSRSASPDCAETMQIFVKNVSGESTYTSLTSLHPNYKAIRTRKLIQSLVIALTVPRDLTVANLTTLLSVRTSLPSPDLRLVYAGKHLSPSSTLSDYRIARESTLHLALPMRGGMPPKKLRCTFKDCREGAQRIIGDCGFCNGHYCGKHRLLEDHKCDGLEDVSSSNEWWLVGLGGVLKDIMANETAV